MTASLLQAKCIKKLNTFKRLQTDFYGSVKQTVWVSVHVKQIHSILPSVFTVCIDVCVLDPSKFTHPLSTPSCPFLSHFSTQNNCHSVLFFFTYLLLPVSCLCAFMWFALFLSCWIFAYLILLRVSTFNCSWCVALLRIALRVFTDLMNQRFAVNSSWSFNPSYELPTLPLIVNLSLSTTTNPTSSLWIPPLLL